MRLNIPKPIVSALHCVWLVTLIFVTAGSTLFSRPVHAAACCTSAAISGVGRLKVWEEFAVGSSISHQVIEGSWNADGAWVKNPEDYSSSLSTFKTWSIVRLTNDIEASLLVPLLLNHRKLFDQAATHIGFGNIELGVRYELISIGSFSKIPGIALRLDVGLPTGQRSDEASERDLLAATTAKGDWSISPSITFEYAHLPWFVKLQTGGRFYLPYDHLELSQTYQIAPTFQINLSGGLELVPDILIASLSIRWTGQAESKLVGVRQNASSYSLWSSSLSLSWEPAPHYTISLTISRELPANYFGQNSTGGTDIAMGFRYGYF